MKRPVLDREWDAETQAVHEHDMREIWDRDIARHIWNQYHNQLEVYLAIMKGRERLDVLDVGSAQGTLALMLAELGHRVVALDIRASFLRYARSRYEFGDVQFICGNAMELELRRDFDIVFANQILEHLVYPVEFLERLRGWIKPGGEIVVTTPNGEYWRNSHRTFTELGDPEQHLDKQFTADGDGHFFAYTSSELEGIVRSAGFENVEVTFFETPWISGHMKLRYLHRAFPYGLLKLLDRVSLTLPVLSRRVAHQTLVRAIRR